MSVPKVTRMFSYVDENGYKATKTFISPAVNWGTKVPGKRPVSINPEDLKTDPLPNNGCGYSTFFLTPLFTYPEYYFGKDDAFNYGNRLALPFGSVDSLITELLSDINADLARNQSSNSSGDLLATPKYSDFGQGLWGEGDSYVRPTLSYTYTANTFNASTFKRTVNLYIYFGIGGLSGYDSDDDSWFPVVVNQGDLFDCFAIGIYDSNKLHTALNRVGQALNKLLVKPCAGFGVLPSGGQWVYTRGGDFAQKTWWFGFMNHDDIFCPEAGAITGNCLIPIYGSTFNFNNGARPWNESGSVTPDPPEPPPGPGPDPDEPLPPPKPGPDDPPQPVDPVDPIPEPDDPPIDGTNCGIYSIYNPDRSQLRQLGGKLWDPDVWNAIKQYFTTPMDAVFSLAIIPVTPSTSGTQAIVIGNYNSHVGARVVNSDYVTFNCGSVYIPKFFNSYLDYDPYTTYKLYLPFIGEVDLNADEITAQTITIKYKVNVVTGDCVALLMKGNNVFAEYNGNCARFLPLSSASYAAFIQATTAFAAAAVTAGASLAGAGATGEAIESGLAKSSGEMTGNGMVRLAGNVAAQQSIGANLASSGINAVMGSKMSYSKAGKMGQGAGQVAVRTPYITITRPNLTLPEKIDQASASALRNYIGYSTNKIGALSSFSGFTVVEACQLSSQHATDSEIAEALSMMKGGIII